MPKKAPLTLWPVLVLLLVAAAVLVAAYAFVLSFAERTVAESTQDRLGLENKPGVELESASPANVLSGEFSGGHISIEDTQFGRVRAESVSIDLDPFDVSVLDSALGGVLRSEEPLSGTLLADVAEEEVWRLARVEADVPVRGVDLSRDGVLVRAAAPVLGVEVPVSIRGTLHLRGEELVFEAQRVEALGSAVPQGLAERALAGTDFAYPHGGLPYGAKISDVEVREGRLVLSGEVERIVLGGSGS